MAQPSHKPVLVAGATGFLGGEIARRLVALEKPVRAIVRPTATPARVDHLRTLGDALLDADLKDPASLTAACRGVDAVISTVSTTLSRQPGDTIEGVDGQGQRDLVRAASDAGVRRFVFISYAEIDDADPAGPCPLTQAKRSVERALRESGMEYVILRPTYFMEIWLGPALGFDLAGGRVTLYGDGTSRASWIALGDVAEFAVQSIDSLTARNTTVDLGGPDAIAWLDVVSLAERISRRKIDVQYVPIEALAAQRARATDSLSQSFVALTHAATRDNTIDMRGVLGRFPIRLTPVEEHVRRTVGSLASA